jgi:hypothetical protein
MAEIAKTDVDTYRQQGMNEHSVEERSKLGPEIEMLEEVFHGLSSVKVSSG